MSAVAAALFLAIAAALQLKKKAPRAVCVLAALSGLGFAYQLAGWLSGIVGTTVAGVAIGLPLTAFLAIIWYCEIAPKGGKPKRWRTPITGFLLPGLIVATVGGPIGSLINSVLDTGNKTSGDVVNSVVQDNSGQRR